MDIPALIQDIESVLKGRQEEVSRKAALFSPENKMFYLATHPPPGRSTTIVAVCYEDGVVMAADRLTVSGWGEAFSRSYIKLEEINQNAVLGCAGWVSFIQAVQEDLSNVCEIISSRIKRPVSLEGKSNLLKRIIRENVLGLPWYQLWGVSFGAILGGYDRYTGRVIASFEGEGGVYFHEDFHAEGSGGLVAKTYLNTRFQFEMKLNEAVLLAMGAVREAGKQMITVSNPLDFPPPTVRIINSAGILEIADEDVLKICLKLDLDDASYANKNILSKSGKKSLKKTKKGEK